MSKRESIRERVNECDRVSVYVRKRASEWERDTCVCLVDYVVCLKYILSILLFQYYLLHALLYL